MSGEYTGCRDRRNRAGKTTRLFQKAKQLADEGACVIVVMGSRKELDQWRPCVSPEIQLVKLEDFSEMNTKIPRDGSPLVIGHRTYLFDHALLELAALFDRLYADFSSEVAKTVVLPPELAALEGKL